MANVNTDTDLRLVMDTVTFITLSSTLQINSTNIYSNAKQVLDVYIYPVILALGLTGNMLSFVVLLHKSLRKSSSTFLLCSLAITDNIVLIVLMMKSWLLAAFNIAMGTGSSVACKIVMFSLYLGSHMSSWTLVLVAIERLISVSWPLRAFQYCSRRRMIIAWVVLLIFFAFINGHIFFTADIILFEQQTVCIFDVKYFHFAYEVLPWIDMCIMTLTLIVLLFCNILIIIILTKAKRRRDGDMISNDNQAHNDHVKDITMMLLSVSFFYMLTTTPLMIYLLDMGWDVSPSLDAMVVTIFELLYCTNNSMNFFLYVLSGSRFRQTLINMTNRCITRH